MMFKVLPGVLTVTLCAMYFAGLDTTPDITWWRHVALATLGIASIAVGWTSKRASELNAIAAVTSPSMTQPADLGQTAGVASAAMQTGDLAATVEATTATVAAPPDLASNTSNAASDGRDVLSFLKLLQDKGRLVDFLMDDVSRYPDAQVGAAARVVHQGAGAALREYFDIKPVHPGEEGAALTLEQGYDSRSYRLLGRVIGDAPFRGHVLHRGWLTTSIKLPVTTYDDTNLDARIIAPAEVALT